MNSKVNTSLLELEIEQERCEKEHLFFTRRFFLPRMGFKFMVNWHHEYICDAIDQVISELDIANENLKLAIDSKFYNAVTLNSDFHEFMVDGDYYVRSKAIAESCLNIPEKIAGILSVKFYKTDSTRYLKYRTIDDKVYESTLLSGVWSAWTSINVAINDVESRVVDLKADSMNSWVPHALQNNLIFDFTNVEKYKPANIGDITTISDATNTVVLGTGTTTIFPQYRATDYSYSCVLKTNKFGVIAGKPIVPLGDFVLSVSLNILNNALSPLFFQSTSGQDGRLQIYANAEFNGSANILTAKKLQVFVGGATGGNGLGGQALACDFPDKPFILTLVKLGNKLSVRLDGKLVDTITAPEIYQGANTRLFRDGSTHSDLEAGRLAIVNSTLTGLEVEAIEKWVGKPFIHKASNTESEDNDEYIEHIDMLSTQSSGAVIIGKNGSYNEAQLLYLENDDHVAVPASLTKVMTAMVLLDIEQDLSVLIERISTDSNSGSGANLNVGDKITLYSALRNLMLPSSNVTANIIGRIYGRKILEKEGATDITNSQATARWVKEINAKAQTLGMTKTLFVSPSGLGDTATTCASDMLKMVCHSTIYDDLTKAWSTPKYDMPVTDSAGLSRTESIETTVTPLKDGDLGAIGGKTGTLPAYGYNVVVTYEMSNGQKIATVTLGASSDSDRTTDIKKVASTMASGYQWNSIPKKSA